MVLACRNGVDAESAIRRCLREVRMVENGEPRVSPWMLFAHYLDLRRLRKPVDGDDFPIIVEWRDADQLSGPDVEELVGLERAIVVGHVERPIGRNRLNKRIENAVVVGQIVPALERESLSSADVGDPDNRSSDPGSGKRDVFLDDGISAYVLVDRRPDDLGHDRSTVKVNGTSNGSTA